MLNEDYKEILSVLLKNRVKFLLVGAYAMGVHGYPRATGDFDIWIESSCENSMRVFRSLAEFGAPLKAIHERTFSREGIVFQIGVVPRRIDIITKVSGLDFSSAYKRCTNVVIEGLNIPCLSKRDLIKNKQAANRDKDKADVKFLRKRPRL